MDTTHRNLNSVAIMNKPLSFRPKIPGEFEEPVEIRRDDGTKVIIENIEIDGRDIDKFRFGTLKAYIKWSTGAISHMGRRPEFSEHYTRC